MDLRRLAALLRSWLPIMVVAVADKLGLAAPQRAWLTAGHAEVADILRGGQIVQRGWVADDEVERHLEGGLSGGRAAEHLWRLFITGAWLRMQWPNESGTAGRSTWESATAFEPATRPAAAAIRDVAPAPPPMSIRGGGS